MAAPTDAPDASGAPTASGTIGVKDAASPAERRRYRRILRFAAQSLMSAWWFELLLPRLGLRRLAERGRSERMRRLARRFHALAVDMGGLMIKVGQFMSSRLDVLPPEITAELEGLQDEVPAVPFPAIRALAEAELGIPLERAYAWVDETPVAAASLGQAHRARLSAQDALDSGLGQVVIKVQRPGIDQIVEVDLKALRRVGQWLRRIRIVADRVDAPQLVEEFARTSREEIDYLHEAASAERFAQDFADDPRVAAPRVAWERTTRRVLTLEDVTAIKITDTAALCGAGIDPADVAQTFARVMFDQLFSHGLFHADPHPGNVFVTPLPGDGEVPWRLTFVDFGMMGEASSTLRAGLRKLLIAVAGRDGRVLVEAMGGIGVLLPSADTAQLEKAMTALFARFGGMGFAQLRDVDEREFRDFALQFGDVMRSLPFQLPENFLLIIRAISLMSGVCSALDPSFNVWDAVEPYATGLLRDERGNLVKDLGAQALESAGILWRLPKRLDGVLDKVEQGTLTVESPRLERRLDRLERVVRRVIAAVVFAGMLVGGAVVHAQDAVFGVVLMVASVIPLGFAVFARRR